jgi:LuxR family maltose regulon positive regulatory protein
MQILSTKIQVPRLRTQLVARARLIEHLQQGMEYPLTLISAPAGSGKTTLLTQWVAQSTIPVAWLSLEPEDNDPTRFLAYIIAALQRHDPQLGGTALSLLEAPQVPSLENILTLLTNDLASHSAGDFALVLDDYHVITAETLHHAMSFLLQHLPSQIHLVIATRVDPPLPLTRLRARGQLIELRATELRLNSVETSTFLQATMGLDLPREAVATLERRTEGWIAGLQLAALSLRSHSDIPAFLTAFTGSHRFILDYLTEEVLSQQPAPILSFLLHTSILGRLSGSLCDAVTGQQGGQALLETLEPANLFLISLDEERHWYRYHHLFADLLHNRLQQTEPALVPELHRRASFWYQEHDLPVEAVRHVLASGDVEQAARLIEQCALEVIRQGQNHLLLNWLHTLPDTLIRTRPRLCIFHASALHLTNQLEEAETRLLDAERALQPDTPEEEVKVILGVTATIRANIARFFGDLPRYITLAQQALNLLQEQEVMVRVTATVQVAHIFLVNGDVTSMMEQPMKTALATARAANYMLVYFRALTAQARMEVLRGRLRTAANIYEEARQVIPAYEIYQVLTASPAYYFGLSDLLREWNRLDEAERLLSQGIELIVGTKTSFADDILLGYLTLARVQQARGEYSKALATLDTFMRLADERDFVPQLKRIRAAARARIALAQGNVVEAVRWMETSNLSPDDANLPYPREQEYLTLARVRIAQKRDNRAGSWLQAILHLLDRLQQDAEAKGRKGSILQALILQALALQALDDPKSALKPLERALTLAETEGYIRLFLDEGQPMLALLRLAHSQGIAPAYVATLLAASNEPSRVNTATSLSGNGALQAPLTDREREVLQLLSEGATNGDIARRLVVSVNTVKRHVYNICSKFGVQNRTQILVRARELDLL